MFFNVYFLLQLNCACKFQCRNISGDHKRSLFDEFYGTVDYNKQSIYLLGLIQLRPISRRHHGTYDRPEESRRQHSVFYTVPDGKGQHIQVCRKTFSEIFAVTHSRVQVLVEKKKKGLNTITDLRGKGTKTKKYSAQVRGDIKAHIDSFPREENHYSRSKSAKQFLSPDLNINRMYRAFKEKYPQTIVTYKFYSEVFHTDFPDLRFGRPRSDTCGSCDKYNNKIKAWIPLILTRKTL